ncbi:hypothetical protein Nepgr_007968 [Nepenthes gracilis]|uniref:Uncharacterized protein n=1 Tax=Nepenthes gracilis TaxID=150966 RepID=A0AAD3S7Z4_NEPGR|nr:hypothetical protein Nepgr_007968 [Nepenthes gracilis]
MLLTLLPSFWMRLIAAARVNFTGVPNRYIACCGGSNGLNLFAVAALLMMLACPVQFHNMDSDDGAELLNCCFVVPWGPEHLPYTLWEPFQEHVHGLPVSSKAIVVEKESGIVELLAPPD